MELTYEQRMDGWVADYRVRGERPDTTIEVPEALMDSASKRIALDGFQRGWTAAVAAGGGR